MELESMAVEMPEVEGHPNRVAFQGVLTLVDVPSDRPPFGSKGKRVVLTRKAAEEAIPSLIGMAVDYAPSLDKHDQQRKVGVITRADVVGRNLEVGGYLYAKDFPEIVEEIARVGKQGRAPDSQLRAAAVQDRVSEGSTLRETLRAAVKEIRRMVQARNKGQAAEKTQILRAQATDSGSGKRRAAGLGMSFEVTNVNVLNPRARIWKLVGVTFTGAAILRKDKAAYRNTWIELS